MKKVSIIIPYYNRAAFFQHTLESVAAQTYRPLEVILVDNGSTDESAEIAENFQRQLSGPDFEVRLFEIAERGAACARNAGLKEAAGEYCYFFDSDDEMTADFIRLAVAGMERGNNDMVGCFTLMVWPDGHTKRRCYVKNPTVADQILTAQLSTQSIFCRTLFIRRAGGWNEHIGVWDDWELGIRLLLFRPRLGWLGVYAFHRVLQHEESMTGETLAHDAEGIIKALCEVADLLNNQKGRERRAKAAFSLRCAVTGGIISHEGAVEAGRKVAECCSLTDVSLLIKKTASILYRYCACGGRGAWIIAGMVLRIIPEH